MNVVLYLILDFVVTVGIFLITIYLLVIKVLKFFISSLYSPGRLFLELSSCFQLSSLLVYNCSYKSVMIHMKEAQNKISEFILSKYN